MTKTDLPYHADIEYTLATRTFRDITLRVTTWGLTWMSRLQDDRFTNLGPHYFVPHPYAVTPELVGTFPTDQRNALEWLEQNGRELAGVLRGAVLRGTWASISTTD